jgi:hypothetical protein
MFFLAASSLGKFEPELVQVAIRSFECCFQLLHVFESFSEGRSYSRSAGLSADSHHLQPRKAVLDQPLRHSTSTFTRWEKALRQVALNSFRLTVYSSTVGGIRSTVSVPSNKSPGLT